MVRRAPVPELRRTCTSYAVLPPEQADDAGRASDRRSHESRSEHLPLRLERPACSHHRNRVVVEAHLSAAVPHRALPLHHHALGSQRVWDASPNCASQQHVQGQRSHAGGCIEGWVTDTNETLWASNRSRWQAGRSIDVPEKAAIIQRALIETRTLRQVSRIDICSTVAREAPNCDVFYREQTRADDGAAQRGDHEVEPRAHVSVVLISTLLLLAEASASDDIVAIGEGNTAGVGAAVTEPFRCRWKPCCVPQAARCSGLEMPGSQAMPSETSRRGSTATCQMASQVVIVQGGSMTEPRDASEFNERS